MIKLFRKTMAICLIGLGVGILLVLAYFELKYK